MPTGDHTWLRWHEALAAGGFSADCQNGRGINWIVMLIVYCLGPETHVAMIRALKTSLSEDFRRLPCLSDTGSPARKEHWSQDMHHHC